MSDKIIYANEFAILEEEALGEESGIVLVDFYADWCGPCKMIAPTMEELAEEYDGRAKIIKINIDENGQAAEAYQIQSIPTVLIMQNGEVIDTIMGANPKEVYADKLDEIVE